VCVCVRERERERERERGKRRRVHSTNVSRILQEKEINTKVFQK